MDQKDPSKRVKIGKMANKTNELEKVRVVPVVLEKIHKSTDMLGDTITHEMEDRGR